MEPTSLTLQPDKGLRTLLPKRYRNGNTVVYPLVRRASVKDIIESLHIPHTEIGTLVCSNNQVSFSYIPKGGERLIVTSLPPSTDVTRPSLLRPTPLDKVSFIVDGNVGKLARLLRMSGLDTLYDPLRQEQKLAALAVSSGRILLSRNRDLLYRKSIQWGHLVRAELPEEQLAEVITLYGLQETMRPFSRCLRCNTLLQPVDKAAIRHRLEPLTIKYYDTFHICADCGRIYWRGSHHTRMEALLNRIRRYPSAPPASRPIS